MTSSSKIASKAVVDLIVFRVLRREKSTIPKYRLQQWNLLIASYQNLLITRNRFTFTLHLGFSSFINFLDGSFGFHYSLKYPVFKLTFMTLFVRKQGVAKFMVLEKNNHVYFLINFSDVGNKQFNYTSNILYRYFCFYSY